MIAEERLRWMVDGSARAPLDDAEIERHVAPALLAMSGGPGAVNAAMAALGPVTLRRITSSQPDRAQAAVRTGSGDHLLTVQVDAAGLVADMQLTSDEPSPGSWTDIDRRLASLAARVSFAAATIGPGGTCAQVHGVAAETPRPIGSAFKLYVLGALAQAAAEGKASWQEPLAIRDDRKSLPSGRMQDVPAGTAFTLAEYADAMISLSDNTATDHLMGRLGRDAVQRQLVLFGHRTPEANIPFPTTRAFFRLKFDSARADEYLALPEDRRAAELQALEDLPLPDAPEAWSRPERIDQIEWFASPMDIVRAFAGLYRFDMPQVGHALSLNDDGLALDPSQFPTVWYKGGSEPGVVTLNYLACTADGRVLAVSLMVSDPRTASSGLEMSLKCQPIIRGAFELLKQCSDGAAAPTDHHP
ncbi:serine hydrolase [Actinomadura fibrosa]|uniref:Serine hydrolase n=1 Tax=Actinomadura fibrosa TaxID=111802 RepID=A0ABW2XWI5_9ACTN|nr:serine hydrolase [Actinomadura fibrosa]